MIPLDALPLPMLSDTERMSYVYANSPPRSRATLIGRVPQKSRFGKGTFVYSIDGILPTFSSWQNVLIYDDRDDLHCGIRYLSVKELALISGLNDHKTIKFLESIDAKDAHKYIGNAITGGTYFHVYDCVQKAIRDSSAAALGHHALSCAIEQYHAAVLKSELAQAAVDASSATPIPTTTSGGYIPPMPTSQLSTKLTELGLPDLDVADIATPITKPGALPRVPLPGTAAYSKCV